MNKQEIDWIRKYYDLPDRVTDENIVSDFVGSLGEAFAKLHFAFQDFKAELAELVRVEFFGKNKP